MLKIKDVTFSYGWRRKPVLSDFSLEIAPGGVYGLLGPNGAGKSTLLHLIIGALTPGKGEIMYNGVNTRRRRPETLRDIFIVPEEFTLPSITLEKYVALNAPLYPNFSRETMEKSLELFELPTDLHLGQLSMGQKKKVFMSYALACNTPLLLMDEPTNGLDIPGKSIFRRFIASSMNDERSIIISTHQVHDIERLLDNVLIMDQQHLLFNQPICDIQSKLQFVNGSDPEVIEKSLYALPNIGGSMLILPNEDGQDTEVNLEVLFDFALHKPEMLNSFFSSPKSDKL